jgi:DNA mismatch repair protein MutH
MPPSLIATYTQFCSSQFKVQENPVKRFVTWVGLTLVLLFGASFAQDSAKQDMKDAGHETKEAAKDTGHATKKTAKKAGHKVKRGTHKAAKKVEDKTQ